MKNENMSIKQIVMHFSHNYHYISEIITKSKIKTESTSPGHGLENICKLVLQKILRHADL